MKDRIKKIRTDNKLSMEKFGKQIGITRSSVCKLESGENNPSEQTIKLICKEFNISYLWLTQGIEPMTEENDHSSMARIDAIMTGENETAKKIFKAFSKLSEDEWNTLGNIIKNISEEL